MRARNYDSRNTPKYTTVVTVATHKLNHSYTAFQETDEASSTFVQYSKNQRIFHLCPPAHFQRLPVKVNSFRT